MTRYLTRRLFLYALFFFFCVFLMTLSLTVDARERPISVPPRSASVSLVDEGERSAADAELKVSARTEVEDQSRRASAP